MSRRHLSTSTVLHGVTSPFCVSIFYLLFVLISILVELAEIASDKLRTGIRVRTLRYLVVPVPVPVPAPVPVPWCTFIMIIQLIIYNY